MIANAAVENVFATIGAVLWSTQLIPQIVKSYRMKDVAGLSSWMLVIWYIGTIFLGAYVVVKGINIPLMIQPQLFGLFATISWGQCIYYGHGYSKRSSILLVIFACVLSGSLEAAFIFGAKAAEAVGNYKLTTACGILSAITISLGLLPQFAEIYRYKAVIGISLVFLLVDLLGGVFSLLSLVFSEGPFDILASLSYGAVAILEIGIFILAAILNPIHRRRLASQREADEAHLAGSALSSPGIVTSLAGTGESVASRSSRAPNGIRGDEVPIVLEEVEELGTPRGNSPHEMRQISDSGKSVKMEEMRARLEWADRGGGEGVRGDENV